MKKLCLLMCLCLLGSVLAAQVAKTINITTSGGLSSALTTTELNSVTNLTIIGTIDARDFVTMRDKMPALAVLDISEVNIAAYTGTQGSAGTTNTAYYSSTIPQYAFCEPNTLLGKSSLKSVSLPNTITSIGEAAFSFSSNLIDIIPINILSTSIRNSKIMQTTSQFHD
jgi:hypothetical protein